MPYKNIENHRSWMRSWRKENPEINWKHNTKSALKVNYGLTFDDINRILKEQNGRCKICPRLIKFEYGCRKSNRCCVDHDHKTMKIRGLLCDMCNKGLGHFNEDEKTLLSAIEYLRESLNE